MGPPNVLDAPKPTSSSRTKRMLGAPFGACTGCGKSGFESLALIPIWPLNGAAGVGRTSCADALVANIMPIELAPMTAPARASISVFSLEIFIMFLPLNNFLIASSMVHLPGAATALDSRHEGAISAKIGLSAMTRGRGMFDDKSSINGANGGKARVKSGKVGVLFDVFADPGDNSSRTRGPAAARTTVQRRNRADVQGLYAR